MVKLNLTPSIGALGLAIGAAGSASHLQSPLPLAAQHLHQKMVHEKLRDVISPQQHQHDNRQRQLAQSQSQSQPRRRAFATAPDGCPGTPFLWKITEDATGKHVGFGLGTMQLPLDVVMTAEGHDSVLAAITDSCDVYGELNMADVNVTADLQACQKTHAEDSATVEDIPDEELKKAIEAKMLEIWTEIFPEKPDLAELYSSRLLTLPLMDVQNIILLANTPEWRDKYLNTLYSGDGALPLDTDLIALGRPGNDLEEVATHCDILNTLNPAAEDFDKTFDLVSQDLYNAINASLSEEIEMYTCGDIDKFLEDFNAGMAIDEFANEALLAERNIQMAEKMNEVLKASPDERVFFAVGLAHWIIGDNNSTNLESLLKEEYGYSLEHVPEWNHDLAEDHANDHCGVMFNPETGLFDVVPEGLFVPGAAPTDVTKIPTHSVILDDSMSPTLAENSTYELVLVEGGETKSAGDTPPAKGTMSPTKMPTEGTPKEAVASASDSSSGALVGNSKLAIVGGFIYLLFLI